MVDSELPPYGKGGLGRGKTGKLASTLAIEAGLTMEANSAMGPSSARGATVVEIFVGHKGWFNLGGPVNVGIGVIRWGRLVRRDQVCYGD